MTLREAHQDYSSEELVTHGATVDCGACRENRRSKKPIRSRPIEKMIEPTLLDSQKGLLLEALAYERDPSQPDLDGPAWQLLPHF